MNREGDYVGKWTNEGGQGGHQKGTALRSRQFAKKGVILRHSNQGKAVLIPFARKLEGTNRDVGAVSFIVLARTGYWRQ